MLYLFDTNNFLRLAEKQNSQRAIILQALRKLRSNNHTICFTPQILAEFWNVCTRPSSARGGLDFSIKQTKKKVEIIQKHFQLLTDNLQTFLEWKKLVSDYSVIGVQVHDAKIVASIITHKVDYLVTFNEKDFKRFPMIQVINPNNI
jgi:predicted nucleic acid-binding protein